MKPEHFLYKSDGLYYMPWLPTEPNYISYGELGEKKDNPNFGLAYSVYEKALERAKAEAVKVVWNDCETIAHLILLKYGETKEGEIYTINMGEKIEVVYQYHSSRKFYTDATWVDCTENQYRSMVENCLGEARIIARIAEPKKQEDETKVWNSCNWEEDYEHEGIS